MHATTTESERLQTAGINHKADRKPDRKPRRRGWGVRHGGWASSVKREGDDIKVEIAARALTHTDGL